MAGGMSSRKGPGAPLWQRVAGAAQPADGTPCWARLPGGETPGTVLAWRRDPGVGWVALVAAWLPAETVRPRDSAGQEGEGRGDHRA